MAIKACPSCGGLGDVVIDEDDDNPQFDEQFGPCPDCNGTGVEGGLDDDDDDDEGE